VTQPCYADHNQSVEQLEPMMLPNARSCSFFLIATSEDASSGKDVPTAIMVSPITRSLTPMLFCYADSTPDQQARRAYKYCQAKDKPEQGRFRLMAMASTSL
jgi:hypothetical protein